jgi:hypothetical protein
VRVLHVYDEREHADARLEASTSADLPRIDAERVLGRLGNAVRDARVTILQEQGALEDTLSHAASGARMLVIGQPGDCRHRGLDERLRASVTCPVVPVPPGPDRPDEHR